MIPINKSPLAIAFAVFASVVLNLPTYSWVATWAIFYIGFLACSYFYTESDEIRDDLLEEMAKEDFDQGRLGLVRLAYFCFRTSAICVTCVLVSTAWYWLERFSGAL